MEKSGDEIYDGQVVLVAQGDIEKSDARYYHRGIAITEVYKTLNRSKDLLRIEQLGLSPELVQGLFPKLDKQIKALKHELGEEVVDILLKGRLKVLVLLDSPAGIIASSDHRKELLKMIQRREGAKGSVDAYLKYASGGAAEIFLQSDERIITPDSLLCPSFYTKGDEEFNESRNFDLSLAMTAKAPSNIRGDLETRIKEILENKYGGDSMLFDAQEMMHFGLATKTVDSLREEFVKRSGITLLPDKLSGEFEQKVNQFFR